MLTLRSPHKTPLHFNKLGRIVRFKTAHAWQVYCLFRSDQTAKENPQCMTLYEEVHPQSSATSPSVHKAFLVRLATMLPPGCVPILITDAGFRGAWFRLVNHIGWHWIGRIRNRDMVSLANDDAWVGCKTL